MYYKLPFLAGMIVVVLVLYFLITSLTAKDMVLSVMLIDAHTDVSSEKMAEEYMEASGSYSMTSLSKFMADIGSELLDVCGMTKDDFVKYDGSQTWMDLRDCLTDEQMTVLEDKLLTTDDGRAIGIMADDLPVLKADNCYTSTDTEAAVGIIYNTPHKEEAVKYLLYLAGAME